MSGSFDSDPNVVEVVEFVLGYVLLSKSYVYTIDLFVECWNLIFFTMRCCWILSNTCELSGQYV